MKSNDRLGLTWDMLCDLERRYGNSFYLLDLSAFRDNYEEFLQAFRNIYPRTHLAYSYKTNYIPHVCQMVNSLSGYAEVVSRMEYDYAVHLGVSPNRIIFNGPYKTREDIETAVLGGSTVNLDSAYEVETVKQIARANPTHTATLGLRCNFDAGLEDVSRFGFSVENGDLASAYRNLNQIENCRVGGLHCHFASLERTVHSFVIRARTMIDLARNLFEDGRPDYLDLGGGFFSKMKPALKKAFACPVPTYHEYATAIAPQFSDAFGVDAGPRLILEPGIGITADILTFVAKIIDMKTVRSRRYALASGSIQNLKQHIPGGKNPFMRVVHNPKLPRAAMSTGPSDIVGYTCVESDCLYRGYVGKLAPGDYVVFDNIGAYSIVMKPPFIRPAPPILAIDNQSGDVELVRRQEQLADVFQAYEFSPSGAPHNGAATSLQQREP